MEFDVTDLAEKILNTFDIGDMSETAARAFFYKISLACGYAVGTVVNTLREEGYVETDEYSQGNTAEVDIDTILDDGICITAFEEGFNEGSN